MSGYPEAQAIYRERGWHVLPLARGTKWPPPNGFTGKDGAYPTAQDYARWAIEFPDGNTCIRVTDEIVGIDVDAYGDKTGAQTLAEAEKRWEPLPLTYRATSREDGVSGIRLFRVPAGIKLHGVVKFSEKKIGDVEVIQRHHRYVVAPPSVHPEGRQYRWFNEIIGEWTDTPPSPEELPELPAAWIEGLRIDAPHNGSTPEPRKRTTSAPSAESIPNVIAAMTEGTPSGKVAQRLAEALTELTAGLSRHDTVLAHVMALLRLGRNGGPGVDVALAALRTCFVAEVWEDREHGEREAEDEFLRMITNAEPLLAAEPVRERFEWPGHTVAFGSQREEDERAEAEFWSKRDTLAHIHRFARSRRVSPWATLGTTLARMLATIPPAVVLPALVGTRASLNSLVALVGASGAGKDTAEAASRDGILLNDGEIPVVPIGSGEGLSRTFRPIGTKQADPNPVSAAVFSALEIDTWAALAQRNGSTLTAEIRKLYTGSVLGFGNAGRDTRNIVAAHSYRAAVLLGVQPLRSGPLLDAADGGLPQRLVWFPTLDPDAPDEAPQEPRALTIRTPDWQRPARRLASVAQMPDWSRSGDHVVLWVPDNARDEIDAHRLAVLRDEPGVDPLDRHTLLTRLKVSAALMALEARTSITEQDWELAGVVMAVSAATRGRCQRALDEQSRRSNRARATSAAERELIIAEKLTEDRQQRVKGAIDRKLSSVGAASRRDLQNACSSVIKPEFPAVFHLLLDQDYLVEEGDDETGKLYRRAAP